MYIYDLQPAGHSSDMPMVCYDLMQVHLWSCAVEACWQHCRHNSSIALNRPALPCPALPTFAQPNDTICNKFYTQGTCIATYIFCTVTDTTILGQLCLLCVSTHKE